ncbi:catalase [Brevifollis gellanilyticus]|uniref:Catalase n=1 Tax=Brevifollis gellanilyticus TaxID=748831 RepID=A0A512MHI9_9BACT|nr:catalase [Brevifollis gellanilyticus]GEP46189.1 catalase [Brevifollis gellanilyticus]
MPARQTPSSKKSSPRNAARLPAETHQTTEDLKQALTTNHGVPISDNQNSLKAGVRGPTLIEDFVLREKITHFDHERIPERIVHARGSGAHGYFQVYESLADITKAAFLQDPKVKTEVFVRFSTVAGGAGSGDMPRDVRGFATKFYTSEGNYDLVGNNIPVFFIQDAMKFPDLVHSVKMEPDRGFPQAASAHDNFWDFVSLSPETMHMLMWTMSDRAIPRSLRMIEGFGVHTFRLVNAEGESRFVKFHWRPKLGAASVLWDEAVKINGADPDFHRRDLWDSIQNGDFPEWELGLQVFDEKQAASLDFDVLDATKLIPEEIIPLRMVGKLVLNRNVDNFFAETEQVAFLPSNIVPGIEFSNDPLLQGRLFSYQDTQLSRLGGPNFHQIPVNAPRCPMHNFQRDGLRQMQVPKGRVNYEPNSFDGNKPRECPMHGFASVPEVMEGEKIRKRSETFADHYSQARLFFRSMTETEQQHIISAFAFELAKVETKAIRLRMLGHLTIIDEDLHAGVAEALGMQEEAESITPALPPRDLAPSPSLSLIQKAPVTLQGRKIGVLITDGFDAKLLAAVQKAAKKEKASLMIVAPKVGGATDAEGQLQEADAPISGAPSVIFDTVVILASEAGAQDLAAQAGPVDWVANAFAHLKFIGHTPETQPLLDKAGVQADEGVLPIVQEKAVAKYIFAARNGRLWSREPTLRRPG